MKGSNMSKNKERDNFRGIWRRLAKKMRFIMDKGCKCEDCGLDLVKNIIDADFHHVNSDEKEKEASHAVSRSSYEKAKIEIDKCCLLCVSCHRKRHFKLGDINVLLDRIIEDAKKVHLLGTPNQKDEKELEKYEDFIKDLYVSGMSMRQISSQENIPLSSVSYTVRKLGIRRNDDASQIKITIKEVKECLDKGMKICEISKKYNCHSATVLRKIKAGNLR